MRAVNLADPTFEPTDEELGELSKRAFADVGTRNREATARLRISIAKMRAEVVRKFVSKDR